MAILLFIISCYKQKVSLVVFGCDIFYVVLSTKHTMGWKGGLKNVVTMFTFMVALVVVQHVKCGDSARMLLQHGGFVQRSGTNFVLSNRHFYFNGFNAYWLMYMASDPATRPKVTAVLQQASSHGLTVARTWAFSDGGYRALQVSPGSYDEKVFRVRTASSINNILFNTIMSKLIYSQELSSTYSYE